jgi:hypothetical protein
MKNAQVVMAGLLLVWRKRMDNSSYVLGATVYCCKVLALIKQKNSWGKNELQEELNKTLTEFIVDTAKNSLS